MKITQGKDGRYSAYGTMKGRKIIADGESFIEAMTEFHTLAAQTKEKLLKRDNEHESTQQDAHLQD